MDKMWSKIGKSTLLLGMIFVALTSVALAQVDAGSLNGTVKDASGGVIPGAVVQLSNENTGTKQEFVTGQDGNYSFTPLRIGTYTLTVTKDSFDIEKIQHVVINIQQQLSVPVTMKPQSLVQAVDVTAGAELLQTESGSVGQVIEEKQINNLPLNGRNYFFLAQLAPGVTFGQSDSRGENSNGRFVANGLRATQNDYLLDGIDNNSSIISLQNGKDFVIQTPVDALSEFKIQTNSYNAEFGRAAGAVLNATVKSGTNAFHGDVWEFLRNEAFDANDYFLNANGKRRPEFRRSQFGGTIGGPVWIPKIYNGRDKTFFFFDYEGLRQVQGNTLTGTVPTAFERNSIYTNFSDLITLQTGNDPADAGGHVYPRGTIFDPSTTVPVGATYIRQPFAGNMIVATREDPNVIKLLNLLPAPTGPSLQNNYITAPLYRDNTNSYDIRVDQVLGKKDYLFARYSYNLHHQEHPGIFTLYQQGYADGGNTSSQSFFDDTARNVAVGYTHTFNPRLVNDLRFGVNREVVFFNQSNSTQLGIPAMFGIQGIPQTPGNGGLPDFTVGTLSPFGASTFLPGQKYGTTPQVNDDITLVRGSHSIKIGFEGQRIYLPYQQPPASRGTFGYSGLYTSVYGQVDGTTGIAQSLLLPTATSNIAGANSIKITSIARHHLVRNYFGAYVQDDWKPITGLTLNMGLRYDFDGYISDQQGQLANFVPNPGRAGGTYYVTPQVNAELTPAFVTALGQENVNVQIINGAMVGTQFLNFAPRLGFAYEGVRNFVVRGGFGLFYGGLENIGGSPLIATNFPLEFSVTKTAANAATPLDPTNQIGLIENTYVTVQATPTGEPASGATLIGIPTKVPTNYAEAYNLSLQYQIGRALALTVAYVGSVERHIQVAVDPNLVGQLLPPGTNTTAYVPYPKTALTGNDFTIPGASSNYNSAQINLESHRSHGLTFLTNFAWQRSMSDARDPLENTVGAYRAPWLPGAGIGADYERADFNVKRVFHASGTYDLPYGRGRTFGGNANGFEQAALGGWSFNAIASVQDGQPFSIPCVVTTAQGIGCFQPQTPGVSPYAGSSVAHFVNINAFNTPPPIVTATSATLASLGGTGAQATGPAFRRLDASLFKQFNFTQRFYSEFRVEVFNVTNTANFANPSGTSPTNPTTFGQITATRDAPNDPREIQLALKLYF